MDDKIKKIYGINQDTGLPTGEEYDIVPTPNDIMFEDGLTLLNKIVLILDALNNTAQSVHNHNVSDITDFPQDLSFFNNDTGFITEADITNYHTHDNKDILDQITPDVFGKLKDKYTKEEVESLINQSVLILKNFMKDTYALLQHTHNMADINDYVTPIVPTRVSQLENDNAYVNQEYVKKAINNLSTSSSHTHDNLDVLNKIDQIFLNKLQDKYTKEEVDNKIATVSNAIGDIGNIDFDNKYAAKDHKHTVDDIEDFAQQEYEISQIIGLREKLHNHNNLYLLNTITSSFINSLATQDYVDEAISNKSSSGSIDSITNIELIYTDISKTATHSIFEGSKFVDTDTCIYVIGGKGNPNIITIPKDPTASESTISIGLSSLENFLMTYDDSNIYIINKDDNKLYRFQMSDNSITASTISTSDCNFSKIKGIQLGNGALLLLGDKLYILSLSDNTTTSKAITADYSNLLGMIDNSTSLLAIYSNKITQIYINLNATDDSDVYIESKIIDQSLITSYNNSYILDNIYLIIYDNDLNTYCLNLSSYELYKPLVQNDVKDNITKKNVIILYSNTNGYVVYGNNYEGRISFVLNATAKAKNVKIDPITGMTSGNVQQALEELFTFANSGKESLVSAIGDTTITQSSKFSDIATYLTECKDDMKDILTDNGVTVTDTGMKDMISNMTNMSSIPKTLAFSKGIESMPKVLTDFTTIKAGNKICLIGGIDNTTWYVYDLETDKFIPSIVTQIYAADGFYNEKDGYIYLIGGSTNTTNAYSGALSDIKKIKINSDNTLSIESTYSISNFKIYHHKCIVYDNYVYIVGGEINGSYSSTVYRINLDDITNPTPEVYCELSESLESPSIAIYKNKLIIVGGVSSNFLDTIYKVDLDTQPQGTLQPSIHYYTTVSDCIFQVVGDYGYIIGGINDSGTLDTIYKYDINKNKLINTNKTNYSTISSNNSVLDGNVIYQFGGYTDSSTGTTDVEIFYPQNL